MTDSNEKFVVDGKDSQFGILGENIRVEGGIHFHSSESGVNKSEDKSAFGWLVTRMCNREDHDHRFKEFFIEKSNDEKCRDHPQFYIIQGNEGQCHNSLVERLLHTHIKNFVRQEWKEKTILPKPYRVSWFKDKELEKHKNRLKHEVFSAVNPRYMGADYSINALCSMPGIKEYNLVLIVHYIQASEWESYSADLLKWYMQDFWSRHECKENMPRFLIFFNIEYPVPSPGCSLLKRLLKKENRVKNRVIKDVETVYNAVKDSCNCLLLEEIDSVSKEDVKNWFFKYTELGDSILHENLKDLFKDSEHKSMAEIEVWLQKIYEKIDRERFMSQNV
ncbi:hypothetical protein QUF70_03910 [Desulfobacterales bacterium HSG17]|nr:hypothetical protein [Desulfobacterales bacterium HSG17]